MTAIDSTQRERLSHLPSAAISDVMERMGVAVGIRPIVPGAHCVGPARTLEVAPGDNAGIHGILHAVQPGEVVVVNGRGHDQRALLGELLALRLALAGAAGIVIDGAVRDVDELRDIGFPVFARDVSPAGPYKDGPWRTQLPIALGGAAVSPGDIVVADSDGVVVILRSELDRVLPAAEAKVALEAATRRELEATILAGTARHLQGKERRLSEGQAP